LGAKPPPVTDRPSGKEHICFTIKNLQPPMVIKYYLLSTFIQKHEAGVLITVKMQRSHMPSYNNSKSYDNKDKYAATL